MIDQTILKRGLRGAILGACIVGVLGGIGIGVPVGLRVAYDEGFSDRGWKQFCTIPPVAALTTGCVGAIAGLAASLPQNRVRLSKSMAIVVASAVIASLPTVVQPRYKGSPEPSIAPLVIGVLVGGVIVFCYGMIVAARSAERGDAEKANTGQSQNPPSVDQPGD